MMCQLLHKAKAQAILLLCVIAKGVLVDASAQWQALTSC
jgi:hypothetical protein